MNAKDIKNFVNESTNQSIQTLVDLMYDGNPTELETQRVSIFVESLKLIGAIENCDKGPDSAEITRYFESIEILGTDGMEVNDMISDGNSAISNA